ncbi:MAG TPA: ROK family protein [Caproicibacter sp.]|nr:ROK family protein [Caproicibacter sp.]
MKIAALDIGGTAIKHCLYDTGGPFPKDDILETPTDAALGAQHLMETVRKILSETGKFDRIAVSTAGQVDPKSGSILFATDNLPGYTGTLVKSLLENTFRVPVVVENDVNSAALGEAFYGAGREFGSFLCLTYGTGIGGAIIQDKRIFYGSSNAAGEFGHIITHAGGLLCTCGGRGCYESYASTGALTRRVRESTGEQLSGREIFARLQEDSRVESIVSEWIDEIIWGLVSLIHALNPPCVILGGGVMNQKLIAEQISSRLPKYLMPNYRAVQVKKAELGNTAGLCGVIHLAEKLA